MPTKLQPDENLLFLYTCLKTAEFKNIDFHAIGAALNIKENAARMRFYRLRKAIEESTGGEPGANPTKAATTPTKRKKDQAKSDEGGAKKMKDEEGVDEVEGGEEGEGN